jgi:ABC-type bacteriocin/lantibiotic exporter with double-glycine peptidase domain
MMLSTQYIVGQLNAPLQQFISFTRAAQDAKISIERLAEIHDQPDEEAIGKGQEANSKGQEAIGKGQIAKGKRQIAKGKMQMGKQK